MSTFDETGLHLIEEVNRVRRSGGSPAADRLVERRFAARFGADRRLAVYGSLAPGRSNHDQLAGLRGRWISGLTVRGELFHLGWGDALGYPGLRWSPDGPHVPVELFVSDDLPEHWERLDAFEGPSYRRILVLVHDGDEVVGVANLYEAVTAAGVPGEP